MFTDSYRPQVNGVVTSIDIFAESLRAMGHKVYIFAPECPSAKNEKFVYRFSSVEFRAYKEYRIGVPYKILSDPRIKKIKFDVVHVHTPFSMGITGIAFARHYKLPTVGTFHTLIPDYTHYFIGNKRLQKIRIVKKFLRGFAWKYIKWFYNMCNVVIAPSEHIMKELKRNGVQKAICEIPTGIKIKRINFKKSTLRKKHGFGKNDKIILHVGRITKEKNIESVIRAFQKLKNNEKLVITSDGPAKKEIESLCSKLRINDRIFFTGYLPENELAEYYHLSDVYVMASETETQGIVLLEAALAGLPIVVLDAPVTANFVQENDAGIVTKKHNLSKTIEKVLADKTMKKKIIEKRSSIKKKYNIDVCTKELVDVYKNAARNAKENSLASKIKHAYSRI